MRWRARRWLPVAAAVAVLVVLPGVDPGGFARLGEYLRRDRVPFRAFGSARTIRLLNHIHSLSLQPPVAARFDLPPRRRAREYARESVPVARRRPLYGPADRRPLPSTMLVPQEWIDRGLPVMSIAVEHDRLQRLWAYPTERGRIWEEPAFVSYFDATGLRFASAAGLRIHGGLSRRTASKNYRLYFRDLYGAEAFPHGVVSEPGQAPIRRLVLDRNFETDGHGHRWTFIDAIAYDLTRRLGVITSRTQPAMLILNGEPQYVCLIVETIDESMLQRRFGPYAFTLIGGRKGDRVGAIAEIWDQLQEYVRTAERPLTMAEAGRLFDLESLSRWFAAVLFCATGDAFQATIARRADGEDRWQWIAWDMDKSFRLIGGENRYTWNNDHLRRVRRHAGGYQDIGRTLLWRLLNEDPSYRHYLAEVLTDALDHRLTSAFFDERLAHYETLLAGYGVGQREFMAEIREFFERRPEVIREQIRHHLR